MKSNRFTFRKDLLLLRSFTRKWKIRTVLIKDGPETELFRNCRNAESEIRNYLKSEFAEIRN